MIRIFNNIEEFACWIMNIVGCVGSVPWYVIIFCRRQESTAPLKEFFTLAKYRAWHVQTIACVYQLGSCQS